MLHADGAVAGTINNAIPDPGAEVSVGGLDVMSALNLTEKDLMSSAYDLVLANHSAPLLPIGQRNITARYGNRSAQITVFFTLKLKACSYAN